jgi:phosphate:Na+ symporter
VAWAHLTFKVAGSLLALPFIWLLPLVPAASAWPPAFQIAALHTAFNLFIAAVFMPILPSIDRMVRRMVAEKAGSDHRFRTEFLNDKVLQFPVLAISQAFKEIERMSGIAVRMVEESIDLIRRHDADLTKKISAGDDEIDFLHGRVMAFLTRISREELGTDEAARAHELIMVATDIEHIGDIVSKSLTMLAGKMAGSPVPLSAEGKQEVVDFLSAAAQLLRDTLVAFASGDHELASRISGQKPQLKEKFESFVECHMQRLYRHKVESLQTTSIHIDLLEEIQRINHFSFRIAEHVLTLKK